MRDYFRSACAEIRTIENIKASFKPIGEEGFTCSVVNRAMHAGVAHITVYARSGSLGIGDLSYSYAEHAPPNTSNGFFEIEHDEFDLFLEHSGWGHGGQKEMRLTPKEAAESLWNEFVERAGISYE